MGKLNSSSALQSTKPVAVFCNKSDHTQDDHRIILLYKRQISPGLPSQNLMTSLAFLKCIPVNHTHGYWTTKMSGPGKTRTTTHYEPKSNSHSLAVDTTSSWSSIYRVSPAKTQQYTSFTDQLHVRPNITIRLATGKKRQTSQSQYNCICLFFPVASLKMTMFGRNT
jgi:hypothetical protein